MGSDFKLTEYGRFSANLTRALLKEVCVRNRGIQTGPFGSQLHQRDYVPFGTPIITVEHLGENRILHQNLPRVRKSDKERLSRYILREGDIVFSRVGSVDRRALVHYEENGWLFSGRCLRIRPRAEIIDSGYLSYFFGHPGFKEYIRRVAVGATMPSLNTKILSEIPVYFPPLPEQRAIAHILGTLDDKIELNRRMNATLEAMARALFKSWFVDFDPVWENIKRKEGNARAQGRKGAEESAHPGAPALPEHILALFPDGFEASELGDIPRGWRVSTIGEEVQCVGGSTPSTKNPAYWEDGSNPFVTPKDMSSLTSPVILETSRHITDAGVNKISSKKLPVGTVLLSSRAPIGYLAITEIPASINQGIIAMICRKTLPNYYVLFWTETNMEVIKSKAGGTTFAEISKRNFRPIPSAVPDKGILQVFVEQVEPMYKQIVSNLQESHTLAALRDTLLPRLISGELRVDDAERFLAEAGVE